MDKKLFFISGIILCTCLLGTILFVSCKEPNILEVTHSYNIDAGEKRVISVVLEKDDRLDLTVAVHSTNQGLFSTLAPGDIGIQVDNPSGQASIPFTRVESGNFIVIADEYGVYVMTLDNSISIFTPKNVSLIMKYPER